MSRSVERDGKNYFMDMKVCAKHGIKAIYKIHEYLNLPEKYAKFYL